ncbi:MAG: hypothetical protein WBE26_01410 [Phycisphaerae bacterium]
MGVRIWCERDTGVVSPDEQHQFELSVHHEDGRPASGVKVDLTVDPPGGASVLTSPIKADSAGRAAVAIRSRDGRGRCFVRAAADDATWYGELITTDVEVDIAGAIRLSEAEESLLRMLFWDRVQVRVLRTFAGGQSGSRVFQVQVVDPHRVYVTQIVKVGPRETTNRERENFHRHFENRLPNAAPIRGCAVFGNTAAIVYGDAAASRNLDPVIPLRDFFVARSCQEVDAALLALLDKGLRRVYVYHDVRPQTYRSLFGRFLPENLVLSLDRDDDRLGIHQAARTTVGMADILDLTPRDVEDPHLQVDQGATVRLHGFRISKIQDDDLNLEDSGQKRHKVKVHYGGTNPTGLSLGDHVDVVARVVAVRNDRLQFAIQHCLAHYGGERQGGRWTFGDRIYPDPLELLDRILEQSCDVAWGTIHGDLHWGNVMLEGPSNWWLIDYGLTTEGPILFDFVKLELYLRYVELAKLDDLNQNQVLDFEQGLAENPLGDLSVPRYDHRQLEKAARAIRAIRRMARPHLVQGLFQYWRMLFAYAVALTKYYPTRDRWDSEGTGLHNIEGIRRGSFWALSVALTVGRLIQWEESTSEQRRLRFRFVPVGTDLNPQARAVALDVGNTTCPGVIDHHMSGMEPECATSLVWKRPELVTEHLRGVVPDEVLWTLHEDPDFDCVASTYLAWYVHSLGFFPPGAAELMQYALQVDSGAVFLESTHDPERAPYALLLMHLGEIDAEGLQGHDRDARRMDFGFEVMDYLCRLEAEGVHALQSNLVPYEHPFWRALSLDYHLFEEHDLPLAQDLCVRLSVEGEPREVSGLLMESPRSALFKGWARRAGHALLVVRWAQPRKPHHRVVISVSPNLPNVLMGLGKALEKAETLKRVSLGPRWVRTPQPRWPDVDNDDPWYDGRSAAHAYTIVDSPRMGTVLDLDEVLEVLRGQWWA